MNLEVEFRAKRRDADSWAFGYPYYDTGACDFEIVETGNFAPSMSEPLGDTRNIHYPVHIDTLSQYTGLKDKKGNKIYNGDILLYTDILATKKNICKVFQNETGAYVMEDGRHKHFNQSVFAIHDISEIVGNIYDNPDILSQL